MPKKQVRLSAKYQPVEFQRAINSEDYEYQFDIMKKKYQTLEQILESKKKEILNKDSIIQIFINKEADKAIKENQKVFNE